MQFSEGATKVVLQPRPGYIPKNPLTPGTLCPWRRPIRPICHHREEKRLHNICPLRALKIYVERSRTLRKSDQLFVSWAPRLPQVGLQAHSTRGMAASWALFRGVSIQAICDAASWASPMTFVRFYSLEVTVPPVAHAVLNVASRLQAVP